MLENFIGNVCRSIQL